MAKIRGPHPGGIARGLPNHLRVFALGWRNSQTKSPFLAESKPKETVNHNAFNGVHMERTLQMCKNVRHWVLTI